MWAACENAANARRHAAPLVHQGTGSETQMRSDGTLNHYTVDLSVCWELPACQGYIISSLMGGSVLPGKRGYHCGLVWNLILRLPSPTSLLHDRMWKLTWISAWGLSLQGSLFIYLVFGGPGIALAYQSSVLALHAETHTHGGATQCSHPVCKVQFVPSSFSQWVQWKR